MLKQAMASQEDRSNLHPGLRGSRISIGIFQAQELQL
jgi:hypothetical protein